eukprot:2075579-Pleurochrysis_carterae.AAC.1
MTRLASAEMPTAAREGDAHIAPTSIATTSAAVMDTTLLGEVCWPATVSGSSVNDFATGELLTRGCSSAIACAMEQIGGSGVSTSGATGRGLGTTAGVTAVGVGRRCS